LYLAGLLSGEKTLAACNFDTDDKMGEAERQQLIEVLSKGAQEAVNIGGTPLGYGPSMQTPAGPHTPPEPPGPPTGRPPGPLAPAPGGNGAQPARPGAAAGEPDVVAPPDRRRAAGRALTAIAQIRRDTGRMLLAAAEHAFQHAVVHAGRKFGVKVRNRRGASTQMRQAALAAVEQNRALGPFLAQVGVDETELLDGAFGSYQTQAANILGTGAKRTRRALEAEGFDPELAPGDEQSREEAAGFLGAALMALAFSRLTEGPHQPQVGEVSGNVPASLAAEALRVGDGLATATLGQSPADQPVTSDVPDTTSVEQALSDEVDAPIEYTWVWGFYSDPVRPYEIHEDLGASDFKTTDPENDPALPDTDFGGPAQPGDHDGCSCEWIASLAEGETIPPGTWPPPGPGSEAVEFVAA
jgi:hypothetical protein